MATTNYQIAMTMVSAATKVEVDKYMVTSNVVIAAEQTVQRQLIPFSLPVAPAVSNATDFKSVPVIPTNFYINLNSSNKKADINVDDQTCQNISTTITSNGSIIFSGFNHLYCFVSISSSTATLIPHTNFVINATFENGTHYFTTTTRLTPRMISDWAINSLDSQAVVVTISELDKTGLSGGDVAVIIIGSCVGAFIISIITVILFKICAYGIGSAMATPKMMM